MLVRLESVLFSLVQVTLCWEILLQRNIFLQPFILSFPYLLELSNWPRSGNYDFKKNEKCLKFGFNHPVMLQGLGDTAVDVWEMDETTQQMSGLCSNIRTSLRVRSYWALSNSDAKKGWNAYFQRWQLSPRAQCERKVRLVHTERKRLRPEKVSELCWRSVYDATRKLCAGYLCRWWIGCRWVWRGPLVLRKRNLEK